MMPPAERPSPPPPSPPAVTSSSLMAPRNNSSPRHRQNYFTIDNNGGKSFGNRHPPHPTEGTERKEHTTPRTAPPCAPPQLGSQITSAARSEPTPHPSLLAARGAPLTEWATSPAPASSSPRNPRNPTDPQPLKSLIFFEAKLKPREVSDRLPRHLRDVPKPSARKIFLPTFMIDKSPNHERVISGANLELLYYFRSKTYRLELFST